MIAILPTDYIHQHVASGELFIARTPVDVPHTSISMLWHKRQNRDAGLRWLRQHLKELYIARRPHNIDDVYRI